MCVFKRHKTTTKHKITPNQTTTKQNKKIEFQWKKIYRNEIEFVCCEHRFIFRIDVFKNTFDSIVWIFAVGRSIVKLNAMRDVLYCTFD